MANTIKGLTVEIGGDTTKLGKALEDVNKKSRDLSSELGQVNRLLKMDPGNADLLAQKQQILADAVSNTSQKLATLKEAERQVQEQFERGEVSAEQVRELQREIVATEQKLQGYETAARETADQIDHLGDVEQETARDTEELNSKLGDFADKGLKGIGSAVGAAVTALTAAAESTREYREAMGKLNTAFTDNGFSAEAATSAYQELQGVLGESDQAVEAANHLAKLTDNEQDLAVWTGDILPGVFATFGDSLPIEGLTEAANETAKVGQVTGPLADALNWAGVSEDAFNESLAACTTEQERQKLIMDTLNGLYGEASQKYQETNADVIAANKANKAWTASLAQVGAAVEPVITKAKNLGAELLEKLVPIIEKILDNLPTLAVLIGTVTAALIAFKISALGGLPAVIASVTASIKTLSAAMLANPIGLIITAIGLLVAAFVYLWNNCEEFREFWKGLWDNVKKVFSSVWDWLTNFFTVTIPGIFTSVIDWVKNNWQGLLLLLVNPFAGAFKLIYDNSETFRNQIKQLVEKIREIFNSIKTFITETVPGFFTNMKNKAVSAVTNLYDSVVSWFKKLPGSIQTWLTNALNNLTSWGSNMVSKAKTGMSNVVSAVVNTLASLPSKVLSIGSDLVTGLWNGINNKLQWLKNQISGFTSSVLGSIKSFFGVHSPSTETAWIGDMLDQGLAEGLIDNMSDPVKAMKRVSGGVLDAANTVDGMSLERSLRASGAVSEAAASADSTLSTKLDKILTAIENGKVLTIDGDTLVGATAGKYDCALGQRRLLAARGAI